MRLFSHEQQELDALKELLHGTPEQAEAAGEAIYEFWLRIRDEREAAMEFEADIMRADRAEGDR